MENTKMIRMGLLAAAAYALSLSANASLIYEGNYFLSPSLTNPASEASWIETEESLAYTLSYLNKFEDKEAPAPDAFVDDGLLSPGTDWFNIVLSGSTGTVEWDLNGSGYELRYVLVKDGRVADSGHLYSLFSVTPDQYLASGGTQSIHFGSLDRAISHVSLFGVQGGTTRVPEPSALLLFGAGLLGLGALRSRRRRA